MYLGCFGAGCLIGKITSLPWGVIHTSPFTAIPPMFRGVPLYPIALYLFGATTVLFLLSTLINNKKNYDGQTTLIILGMYAVSCFIIDELQSDYLVYFVFGEFSVNRLISISVFFVTVIGFLYLTPKGTERTDDTVGSLDSKCT